MMQELIWYIECYGPWVAGGLVLGTWFGVWLTTRGLYK